MILGGHGDSDILGEDDGSDCAENDELSDSVEIPDFDEGVGNGAQLALMANDTGVNEDPKSYIGRQIAKQYEGIFYVGKIVSFELPEADDVPDIANEVLYKVAYEDGDSAKYTHSIILCHLIPVGRSFIKFGSLRLEQA